MVVLAAFTMRTSIHLHVADGNDPVESVKRFYLLPDDAHVKIHGVNRAQGGTVLTGNADRMMWTMRLWDEPF